MNDESQYDGRLLINLAGKNINQCAGDLNSFIFIFISPNFFPYDPKAANHFQSAYWPMCACTCIFQMNGQKSPRVYNLTNYVTVVHTGI